MRLFLLPLLLFTALPAQADDAAYLDDRSTAEAVVASYYNAINRHEYARAYSYFGTDAGPAYDKWAEGYAETETVTLTLGKAISDGAAGSIYFDLPVTLDVTQTTGTHQHFAGCYKLRLVQPTNQEPPFQGTHIESAELKSVEDGAALALPTCPES